MGVTSEQDCRNMNRFVVSCAFLAVAMGAPSHVAVGSLGYAGQVVSAPVAHAPAVVGQTHHSYAAGPAVVENKPVYGVVGQRTVQTGEVSVVAGHQYAVAGVEHIPQPATSYVAGAPQNLVETRALPAPVIPAAPAPYAAIPPAPVPAGPAPADTVTQTRIAAPVRSTPGSPPRSPTSSPRSRSTSTTLMSPSLCPELSPVRSLSSRRSPSHTRSQSPELSPSQPHTRSTQSKRLSRLPTSTTRQSRPTPPRPWSPLTLLQSTLLLTLQLLLLTLPPLLLLDTPMVLNTPLLLPQLPPLSSPKQHQQQQHR